MLVGQNRDSQFIFLIIQKTSSIHHEKNLYQPWCHSMYIYLLIRSIMLYNNKYNPYSHYMIDNSYNEYRSIINYNNYN